MSEHAIANAKAWYESIVEMVADEDAQQHIHENVLSVMVRDGWRTPGVEIVGNPAEEYEILLTTGGPALRIYGRLGRYGEPDDDPELQWQDWGTPWTRWWPDNVMGDTYRETMRTFASQFYFGD